MRIIPSLLALTLIVTVIAVFLHSYLQHRSDTIAHGLRVVCTTSMITDAVQKIGGDLIEVHGLMGPGIDPHTYKPTAGDMHRLMHADLILYHGLHLEGKMAELLASTHLAPRAIAVTDTLDTSVLLTSESGYSIADPHIWFDVELWMQVITHIGNTLIQRDTNVVHQENYRSRTASYLHELDMLNQYLHTKARAIPARNRILVTAHDAFHYFARAYGFQVRALQGVSTDSDISTRDIQELVDFIVAHQIPAMFVESCIPHRTLQAVQAAVRAHGYEIIIGPELYSDALGAADTQASSYIGMIRYTMDTIVDTLLAAKST